MPPLVTLVRQKPRQLDFGNYQNQVSLIFFLSYSDVMRRKMWWARLICHLSLSEIDRREVKRPVVQNVCL